MAHRHDSVSDFDHRRLGQRLGLFSIDPQTGRGLPLWLPHGTVIREELEKLAKELEFRAGFERVATPHIARTDLYHRSGHLPYFRDGMYPVMEVVEEAAADGTAPVRDAYALRPMNCPHHHRVFAAQPRSYRDLPLRLAEYGQVYRWERSGSLSGLARVRGMCMNDGHIYCTRDQVESEVSAVLDMYQEVYALFGIDDHRFRLSRRSPSGREGKYVDDAGAWTWAEELLSGLLRARGIDYEDGIGHAAFYGPKIDIQVTTSGGMDETLSTVQLDFAQPRSLGLTYVASGGGEQTPFCIHRAPFSTHERFVAFLTERLGGAFPTWLAPVQLRLVPVSDRFADYGAEIVARLREQLIRAELASPSETVSRNIRDAVAQRIPNVAVVGRREQRERRVTVRRLGVDAQLDLGLEEFECLLLDAVRTRARHWGSDGPGARADA